MVMGRRAERLAEEIREQVARMIASDLKDPRLGFITVTRVELAHDLGHVRVHVGVLGSEVERKKSLQALQQASGFVRRELGKRLRIRHTPEVDFRYDKGLDATDRVAHLLEEERRRSLAHEAEATEPVAGPEAEGDEGGGKPE